MNVRPVLFPLLPLLAVLLLVPACELSLPNVLGRSCQSDSECRDSEVCFADGCGDPGDAIAVEVVPDLQAGRYAQDFAIESLGATQDFRLVPTTSLQGILREAPTVDADGEPVPGRPYTGRITLQLAGESAVIPDLSRSANLSLELTDGRFSMPVASGIYVGTLTTADRRFPPLRFEVKVDAGTQQTISLELPSEDSLREVHGRLSSLGLPLLGQSFLIEPLDPETREHLGQPATSDPLTGTFSLSLPAHYVVEGTPFRVRVIPTSPLSPFPSRTIENVSVVEDDPLHFDQGAALPRFRVSGTLVGPRGQPVVGATIYAEVETVSGGTARSETVLSDAKGAFSVDSFPTTQEGGRLWIIPAARDAAGQTRVPFTLDLLPLDLGEQVLPVRTPVRIIVEDAEGRTEEHASVVVDPVASVHALPLPTYGAEGVTLSEGVVMWLEPGVYRVNVRRGAQKARLSRLITVLSTSASADAPAPEQEERIPVSQGRTVTGRVVSKGEATSRAIPNARIRYVRRVESGDLRTHSVLAETTTADDGTYAVTVPTR